MKRILPFILCFVMLLSGCGGEGKTFTFMIYSTPKNFDPLFATTTDEHTILDNTMEGMFAFDKNGDIVPAGASEFFVSSDKKTYTIKLKENVRWSNDTPVTAHDYVFTFERMFSSTNLSPYAADFFVIAGARELYEGKSVPLGVTAVDDYTLTFSLTESIEYFPELLCSAAAFPCNRNFFVSTAGKYGLTQATCLFNGPFVISNIKEDAIYLKKNAVYHDRDKVALAYVSLPIGTQADDPEKSFVGNKTDAAFLSATQLASVGAGGNHLLSSENTTWSLIFSSSGAVSNINLRKAFAHTANPASFMEEGAVETTPAQGIVPPSVSSHGKSYRDLAGNVLPEYSPGSSAALLEKYKTQSKIQKLPTITVLCPDIARIKDLLESQLQIWQRDIGVFVNVKTMDLNAILETVAGGNYDMALIPFNPSYNSPLSILNKFTADGPFFKNGNYDRLIAQAVQVATLEEKNHLYQACEEMLMDQLPCLPLFCRTPSDGASPQIRFLQKPVFRRIQP